MKTPRDEAIEVMRDAFMKHVGHFDQAFPAALDALLDHLSEPLATIPQRVRLNIGACERQRIALAYAEAEIRSFLNTLREKG